MHDRLAVRWSGSPGFCLQLVGLATAMLGVACVYPTDRSEQLTVEMDSVPTLLDGEIDTVTARVLDPAGNPVPDVSVTFSTSDVTVALVAPTTGVLLAAGPGEAEISAVPVGYEGTVAATQIVVVRDLVAIDSVRPLTRSYGETIDVYGIGLWPPIQYTLGGANAPLYSWTPEDPRRPKRFGVLRVWVAPPASRNSELQVISQDGNATADEMVTVQPRDIYEPNEATPSDLGVLGQLHNPALFFEQRRDELQPVDWYRFTTTGPADRTVAVVSQGVNTLAFLPFLSNKPVWQPDSLSLGFDSETWVVSPGLQVCQGVPVSIDFTPGAPFIAAGRGLPASTYDLLLLYFFPGPGYELTVIDSYFSLREPDGAEENDVCTSAQAITLGEARILTIDNPYDPDWFSFSLDAAATVTFNVETTTGGPGALDPDLDIRVFRDFAPDSLPMVAFSESDGAVDQTVATLAAGNYLLLITDFAGVHSAYRLTSAVTAPPQGASVDEPLQVFRATDRYSPGATSASRR